MLDFAGSAPQHEGNLNCPLAVTRSACLFAVRVLTDPDIPPSAGAYRPIEVRAPEGTRRSTPAPARRWRRATSRPPRASPTSCSRAFGRALGQGTMNNLTLGNARFSYYETLGGGQGACPDADGPSGVHVAMSNTLNTPIEALEREFPLRVIEYALRRGSGGAGRHRGGDGVVRELEALEEMTFSLIAERRRHAPRGAAGRRAGAPRARSARRASRCPARPPGRCAPASGCASKRPVEEDSDMPERIGFLGLGIMGSRMAANLARAGFPLTRLDAHPRQGRALGIRARRDAPVPRPAEVARGERHRAEHGRRRRAGRRGAARRGRRRSRPRATGCCAWTCRRSRPSDTRRIGAALGERGVRMLDAPVTGSSPRAEDGLADDHGRRRRRGLRAREAAARGDGRG